MRLLVVEDSEQLAMLFGETLNSMGYRIDRVATAEAARVALGLMASGQCAYAAVLLDLGLPDEDGMDLLRAIRAHDRQTPIIVITARSLIGDRVGALRAGANDYLVKPFDFEELAARLGGLIDRATDRMADHIQLGHLIYEPASKHLECRGKVLLLPARERDLVDFLLRRTGRLVPRAVLEHHLYGLGSDHGSNVLDVLIHRLRRRLKMSGAGVQIETIRGSGVVLTASSEQHRSA